jgi:hypothetical protein
VNQKIFAHQGFGQPYGCCFVEFGFFLDVAQAHPLGAVPCQQAKNGQTSLQCLAMGHDGRSPQNPIDEPIKPRDDFFNF